MCDLGAHLSLGLVDTNNILSASLDLNNKIQLTPKGLKAIIQVFLKFRQAIVDAIFVQKISNFGENLV
jgi:hypothetical protein